MRYLTTLLIGWLAASSGARAHSDDAGDIHPDVRIEDGRFAVYFRNTTEDSHYKTTLAANGSVVTLREKSAAPPKIAPPVPPAGDEMSGIMVPTREAFYIFPRWEGIHGGSPFLMRIADRKVGKIALKWGGLRVGQVDGAAVSEDVIVITGSPEQPEDRRAECPLGIHSFDAKSLAKLHSADIGDPSRIYTFPLASNVVIAGGHAHVAWMSRDGETLNLTRFDPRTGACETRRVGPGWGNSTPSIGVIGDTILVCHHCPLKWDAEKKRWPGAVITYDPRSLSELFGKAGGPPVEDGEGKAPGTR